MVRIRCIIIPVLFLLAQITVRSENRFEHRIVAGLNFGATSPGNIPPEVRKITAWYPHFSSQLGYCIIYNTAGRWAVSSGISLDHKGMGVTNEVEHLYTEVRLETGGDYLSGYFSGKNKTDVKTAYITVPLSVRYRTGKHWWLTCGGYASYTHSASLTGSVWDGYLRTPDPTGPEILINSREEASFDFGGDVRDFDFGLSVGGEYSINSRFKVLATFNRGLTSILKRNLKAIPFNMYNMYLMFGMAYRL
ncbi:MAG: PorT family protein [Dysgonamonadaceae bacterium]|jgi:hypothetical protein|nr:PorT family protein [Dysgonamonadaceae bacterium]